MHRQSKRKLVRLLLADKSNAQHLLRYSGSHSLKLNLIIVWLLILDSQDVYAPRYTIFM